jgi:hypothetical protein
MHSCGKHSVLLVNEYTEDMPCFEPKEEKEGKEEELCPFCDQPMEDHIS